MTLEQVEAAGAKVWLDESLSVRFLGPDSVKAALRSDPAIKLALRKELMIREWCQLCRRFKSQSADLKTYWEDLESLPRKLALGKDPDQTRTLVQMLLDITRPDWYPRSGKELVETITRIFETK